MCSANIFQNPCKADVRYTAGKISMCPAWKITCPVGHIATKVNVLWDKIYMPRACGHALMLSPESWKLISSVEWINQLSHWNTSTNAGKVMRRSFIVSCNECGLTPYFSLVSIINLIQCLQTQCCSERYAVFVSYEVVLPFLIILFPFLPVFSLPHHLASVLLAEAIKQDQTAAIATIIANWPLPVLW